VPTFISLVSFTQEGMKHLKDTGRRAKEFAKKLSAKGVVMKSTFWTTGRYDIVHVFEAPDDQAAAAVAFALGSMGTVRTETLRAYNIDEMTKILGEAYDLHIDRGTLVK
jgi:uncharacterized protein with GYD domain